MDRGAWWATVHGVTKSWTWLSNSTHMHAYPCMHIHVYTYTHIHWVGCGWVCFSIPIFQIRKLRLEDIVEPVVELEVVELEREPSSVWPWSSNSVTIMLYCLLLFKCTHDRLDWLLPLREIKRYEGTVSHTRRKMTDAGERHMSGTRSLRGHFYLGRSQEASWRMKHLMRKVGDRFWACRREGVRG